VQREGTVLASDSKKLLKDQVLFYFLLFFSFDLNLLLRLIISHPALAFFMRLQVYERLSDQMYPSEEKTSDILSFTCYWKL
jgi:hypothetical protein